MTWIRRDRSHRSFGPAALAWTLAIALLVLAPAAFSAPPGSAARPGGSGAAPAAAAADSFRVFEADLGQAWIDVGAYPPAQQQAYALFSQKCSKCHTLARPINSALRGDEWSGYVNRMSRKPGSGIGPKDVETILGFLIFDSTRRSRTGSVDPELLPFLEVSRELSGVRRFPASKQDIRPEGGTLRVTVEAGPRTDVSTWFASGDGQRLVRWTRREPNRGEVVLQPAKSPGSGDADPAVPAADAAVKQAAAEATEGVADPRERVESLLDWLDEEIRKEFRAGTAAPAAILSDRRGDATEFTRLFVEMARSSGLPARTRVGFVARRTGFFLHPWAEVWIGGWTAVDPYLGQFPADLTHILLATPGADALGGWEARRFLGLDALQLRVLPPESRPAAGGGS